MKFNYHNEFAPELMHELMREEQHMQMQENLSDMGYQIMGMYGELEMMAEQMAKGEISNYAQEDLDGMGIILSPGSNDLRRQYG